MNKIYGYDTNIYETTIGDLSNSGLRIYEGNVSTSTGKVVVNGVEVTDIESWNKALDTFANLEQKIEEKDKEIERLNEELGDANYIITQLHKVMDRHYVKKEDYDRLNNIINELEKWLEQEYAIAYANSIEEPENGEWYIKWNERKNILDKLKKLKEGK